jgi:hypothetical protein
MLIVETLLLWIVLCLSLFRSSICNALTTTRGLTAYIIAVSLLAIPVFHYLNQGILYVVNKWRKSNNLEEIDMEPVIFEMSFASTGRLMDFYEDFYAVTIVSYIYY